MEHSFTFDSEERAKSALSALERLNSQKDYGLATEIPLGQAKVKIGRPGNLSDDEWSEVESTVKNMGGVPA